MFGLKIQRVIGLVVLLAAAGSASISRAQITDSKPGPDLPPAVCDSVKAPSGNVLAAHVYAVGVQIYRWNGSGWTFVEPSATLFADANHHVKTGIHYAGPTWESNNGGKVTAARLESCSPDPTAIPWLLLQATSTDGPGVLNSVTYIQRVNTVGGLVPTAPGVTVGAVAEVPYAAEYYFYRAKR